MRAALRKVGGAWRMEWSGLREGRIGERERAAPPLPVPKLCSAPRPVAEHCTSLAPATRAGRARGWGAHTAHQIREERGVG